MKILIIKLGALGDVLRTTSILEGLKKKYMAEISWLTNDDELLKNNRFIDKIITDENKLEDYYDLIISLDEDACETATRLKKKKLIGCYVKDKAVYTDDSASWFDMGLISRYGKEKADELKKLNNETYQQHLKKMFDLANIDIEINEYVFNLTEKEKEFGKRFAEKNNIKKNDLVIGINTGAGKRWEKKRLSANKTIELINKLKNHKLILFGGPEEVERNKNIIEKTNIIDAGCDNSLREFASLINLCDIVVSSDTLALHLAIALKKKVVAFFGPTSAAEIDLYGRGIKIIPNSDCYCCYKKKDEEATCTDKITANDLIKAVKNLID